MEPVFESQTKTKLGSTEMGGDLPTVRTYINDFVKTRLDNFLHRNSDVAEKLQKKILCGISTYCVVICHLGTNGQWGVPKFQTKEIHISHSIFVFYKKKKCWKM